MKKHTLLAVFVAIAAFTVGMWGSMQNVSAKDTIKVIPAGVGKTVNVSNASNDKKASYSVTTKAGSSRTVANQNAGITIEVVPDNKSSNSTTKQNGTIAGIAYDKLVMANVEEAVNIRDAASEEGKIIGKFYKECGGTVLEKGNGWTKVQTGDVTGWINNDYLLFGNDAAELAQKVVEKTATCTTDCLRVRSEASKDAKVLELLAEGDQIEVVDEEGEWVKVEFSDGDLGFVSGEFVEISDVLGTGKTMEEINAQAEAERKEKEAALAASKKASDSSAAVAKSSAVAAPTATNNGAVAAGFSDLVLLAALIQAEAGTQPYEGQVAVGSVVMNRLRSGRYGGTIYSVIYAKSQFGPAGSGQVAQIAAAGPKASCLQAAQDALNGVSYVGTATHFRNIRSGYQGIVIGSHVFW